MKLIRRFAFGALGAVALIAVGWVAWLYIEYPNVPDPAPMTVAACPQKIARVRKRDPAPAAR